MIIVSAYFPPSTLAGVHRARHLAKHLPAAGWTPIIVCVDEAFHDQRLDPELAMLVPSNCEVVKVSALSFKLTKTFGFGDISLRAGRSMRRKVFELLNFRRIDAVMITGSPFYPMLLAREIKHRFKVPVVLDFQDPWISSWGEKQRLLSKAGVSHKLATLLEPIAVRAADFITSVSDTQNMELADRYAWLDRSKMAAIPIGGDPEDFDCLRNKSSASGHHHLASGKVNLSYVGTFMPRTGEPLRALFRAFRQLQQQAPDVAARVRMNFIGTSNQPNDTDTFRVKPIAEQEGVADSVYEIPQRLPYLEAITVLARSDGILLIGSDEPHYTASKIYPALMSGTPYLSLFHEKSSAHEILSSSGGGVVLSFDGPVALCRLIPMIADGLNRLASHSDSFSPAHKAAYVDYAASAVARRYAEIFDRLRANT